MRYFFKKIRPWLLSQRSRPLKGPQSISYHQKISHLHALFYRPEDAKGPFPVVMLIHGGGWSFGLPKDMDAVACELQRSGYAVFSVSHRFSHQDFWPAPFDDIKEALNFLTNHHHELNVDLKRIATFGYSSGGQLVLMLAYTDERIRAVVSGGAPVDFLSIRRDRAIEKLIGKRKSEIPDAYRSASPISYVSSKSPPTFIYHGRFDAIVSCSQARLLRDSLSHQQVVHEYHELNLGHIGAMFFDRALIRKAIQFLDRILK